MYKLLSPLFIPYSFAARILAYGLPLSFGVAANANTAGKNSGFTNLDERICIINDSHLPKTFNTATHNSGIDPCERYTYLILTAPEKIPIVSSRLKTKTIFVSYKYLQ